MTRQAVGHVTNLSWDQLIRDGYIIAGSPASVVEQMKKLIHSLRVGNILCLIHVGNMPDEKTRHSSKLFAEVVMPHLRARVDELGLGDAIAHFRDHGDVVLQHRVTTLIVRAAAAAVATLRPSCATQRSISYLTWSRAKRELQTDISSS